MSVRIRIATMLVVVAAVRLSAATHVWTGASSNLFSDPRNWSGGSPAGDPEAELVFPEALRQSVTNDVAGLTVRSITFATDGYVVRGNAITLLEGAEIEARENEIACELRFDGAIVEAPAGGHARFTREARPEISAEATPRIDAKSQVLTFGRDFVSARVTELAETAWLARVPRLVNGSGRVETYATRASDTDGNGTAEWQYPSGVGSSWLGPSGTWCVVDQAASRIHVANGDGSHIEPAALNARFLVDRNGDYSIADLTWTGRPGNRATLWVRPGVGAWHSGGGFSPSPQGQRSFVHLQQMSPVAGSPHAPAGVEAGDLFVGMGGTYAAPAVEVFGGLVDDALAASPRHAAQVGLYATNTYEHNGRATFWLERYGSTERPITVSYRTSDGTAVAGVHYEAVVGTVTLQRGEQRRSISIPLINDDIYSGNPSVIVELTDVSGGTIFGAPSATAGVQDDDSKPVVSAVDTTVMEGGDGERHVAVELTLTGKTRVPADVEWRMAFNSYESKAETVVFALGETVKTISIPYNGNDLPESDRKIMVELFNGTHAIAGRDATVYIIDDDSVGLTAHDVTVGEAAGAASVLVTLSAPLDEPVTVSYDTYGLGYAMKDSERVTGQLTFEPGQTEKRVTVPIVQDQVAEDDEIVVLGLYDATPNALVRRPARITITDDGDMPSITLEGVTVEETYFANLYFTMEPSIEKKLRFGLRAIAGTATAGVDYKNLVETYEGTSGYIDADPWVFPVIAVGVYGDSISEPDETFTVEMFEW
ncbi:MAG TPA: Calx-beta domain-containing protein, partial [Thermoanaerobaculia bacterium]